MTRCAAGCSGDANCRIAADSTQNLNLNEIPVFEGGDRGSDDALWVVPAAAGVDQIETFDRLAANVRYRQERSSASMKLRSAVATLAVCQRLSRGFGHALSYLLQHLYE